jgi:methionine-R-sulfoxide reductase
MISHQQSRSRLWFGLGLVLIMAAVLFFLHRALAQREEMSDAQSQPSSETMSLSRSNHPSEAELRQKLTPLQYRVTRENGTERAFHNEYWNNHRAGIYVDIISGEPLFSSTDKFESGTGWPSFTQPLPGHHVVPTKSRSIDFFGTEVRSNKSDAHLGHVFDDGPAPTGLRYCINSAALRFVPAEKLQEEGYGEYTALFEEKK